MSYKFKVGDKIAIRSGAQYHGGKTVTIKEVESEQDKQTYYCSDDNGRCLWVWNGDILTEEGTYTTQDTSAINDHYTTMMNGAMTNLVQQYRSSYIGADYGYTPTPTPNKPIMKTVSTMMKKLLDADTQKLIKAGLVNGDLELTERGHKELTAILFTEKKKEMVEVAKEIIKEEKE